MAELLSLAEAQARVLEQIAPLDGGRVAIAAAAGRVLAEDARAVVDLPPFPSSAMDGFAVRAADTPGRLPIVARVAAGMPAPRALAAGEAMAIATGGVVPDGADSVIPIEYVVEHDNEVELGEAVAQGDNVRPRGGDVEAGDVVVPKGARLGSPTSFVRDARSCRSLRLVPSCAGRATHWAPERSTKPTASCWRPRSPPPGRTSRRCLRSPTTRLLTVPHSSEA